jgi:hypothetical protein
VCGGLPAGSMGRAAPPQEVEGDEVVLGRLVLAAMAKAARWPRPTAVSD